MGWRTKKLLTRKDDERLTAAMLPEVRQSDFLREAALRFARKRGKLPGWAVTRQTPEWRPRKQRRWIDGRKKKE